jgi:hypothetical protein
MFAYDLIKKKSSLLKLKILILKGKKYQQFFLRQKISNFYKPGVAP